MSRHSIQAMNIAGWTFIEADFVELHEIGPQIDSSIDCCSGIFNTLVFSTEVPFYGAMFCLLRTTRERDRKRTENSKLISISLKSTRRSVTKSVHFQRPGSGIRLPIFHIPKCRGRPSSKQGLCFRPTPQLSLTVHPLITCQSHTHPKYPR